MTGVCGIRLLGCALTPSFGLIHATRSHRASTSCSQDPRAKSTTLRGSLSDRTVNTFFSMRHTLTHKAGLPSCAAARERVGSPVKMPPRRTGH